MSSRSSVAAIRPLVCSSSDQPLCRCQDLCSWLFPQFCLSPAVFGLSLFGILLHGRVTHQVRYSPFRCRSLSPSLAAKGPVYCFSLHPGDYCSFARGKTCLASRFLCKRLARGTAYRKLVDGNLHPDSRSWLLLRLLPSYIVAHHLKSSLQAVSLASSPL